MADEPWDAQRKAKYRDHDLVIEDVREGDFEAIRSSAVRSFIETRGSDNVRLICQAFMGYLTSKGYRITKENK